MTATASTAFLSSAPAGGLYVLLVELRATCSLQVGALGTFTLPAGMYLYTGSARRGLRARVARHLAAEKSLRWHMDYLTTAPGTRRLGAVMFPVTVPVAPPRQAGNGPLCECELNRRAGALAGGVAPVPGFGASDCRAGCPAHLWYTGRHLSLDDLAELADLVEGSAPHIIYNGLSPSTH